MVRSAGPANFERINDFLITDCQSVNPVHMGDADSAYAVGDNAIVIVKGVAKEERQTHEAEILGLIETVFQRQH